MLPSPSPRSPVVAQSPTVVQAQPRLLWIATRNSASCLWPRTRHERSASSETALQDFEDAVIDAQARVWILDAHFDGPGGYAPLRDALEVLLETARDARRKVDIRILTGRFRDLKAWFATENVKHDGIEIRPREGGYHDRYALVDNELWHFGSTVGGSHPDLSSASRGWTDHAHDFEQLFVNWWK